MRYLLDTCVISELVAIQPNQHVVDCIDGIDSEAVYLSVITIGEIRKRIEKLSDSKRKSMLQRWLEGELLVRFSGRILPIDLDVILIWGKLKGVLELTGRKMAAMDFLITAMMLHAKHAGVRIVNPWKTRSG